jgi:hypothetical protein
MKTEVWKTGTTHDRTLTYKYIRRSSGVTEIEVDGRRGKLWLHGGKGPWVFQPEGGAATPVYDRPNEWHRLAHCAAILAVSQEFAS